MKVQSVDRGHLLHTHARLASPEELRRQADLLMASSYHATLSGNDEKAAEDREHSKRLYRLASLIGAR
jgi:hypothetical protein